MTAKKEQRYSGIISLMSRTYRDSTLPTRLMVEMLARSYPISLAFTGAMQFARGDLSSLMAIWLQTDRQRIS